MRGRLLGVLVTGFVLVWGGIALAAEPRPANPETTSRAGEDAVSAGAAARTAAAQPAADGPTRQAGRTPLSPHVSMYPRAVQLRHSGEANGRILASAVTFTPDGEGAIFESTDQGATFTQVGSVPASVHHGSPGLCCATLYELPSQVGDLPAGTLLWAGTVGADAGPARRIALDVWRSDDLGRTWSYLSTCAEAPNDRGLWEPEFSVDAQGRLVCHYADETDDPPGSQRLMRVVSADGITWTDRTLTVQSLEGSARPGMPVVRPLPDGRYVMVFEICATPGQYDCAARVRFSPDGWDWGDPLDRGALVTSESGRYFAHAPTIAWADDGTPNGQLIVVGQMVLEADGEVSSRNGVTIFTNATLGEGPWTERPAPVRVPTAYNNYCPNYSSALLPLDGGRRLLEIATDYDEAGICRSYFGTGRLVPAAG